MSVSAVEGVSEGYGLALEEEISLSEGIGEMARYLSNSCGGIFSGNTHRRERVTSYFFILRSLFSHLEKQSRNSTYEQLRRSVSQVAVSWTVFGWSINSVIRLLRTLSVEDHRIPLGDLKEVAITLLQSAYLEIPASCCDFCSDQRLEIIRGTLLGLGFFLGNGKFGPEVDRVVEDMYAFFTSTPTTRPNGLRHQQFAIRTYIDRLLKLLA